VAGVARPEFYFGLVLREEGSFDVSAALALEEYFPELVEDTARAGDDSSHYIYLEIPLINPPRCL
jgi:hypothetical protein